VTSEPVPIHYTVGNLADAFDMAIERDVADPNNLTIDDLAPADEFHIGGREATASLMSRLGITKETRLLDIGAGIGGPARFVARAYGCAVNGVELTPEYAEVANMLTARVGLESQVAVEHADALEMQFADATFDGAYMLHAGMNIADKPALFREVRRVLKTGGPFGIYDVLRGPNPRPMAFPLPWASSPDASFLATIDELRAALERAGFAVERAEDKTEFALRFFEQTREGASHPPRALGPHLLMGENAREKYANMVRNVAVKCCAPWEVVARRR